MPEPWSAPRALLGAAQGEGVFSAAVLAVQDLTTGRILAEHVCGTTESGPDGVTIRRTARFDLASLTKLVTSTAALRLAARGSLDLDAPVGDQLGGRVPLEAGATITARHLLAHTSGLPAWAPLWERGDVLDVALQTAPVAAPGAQHTYSDIGFLWLAAVLQSASSSPLADLLQREVLGPLGMADTRFHPLPIGPGDGDVVATERCPQRGLLRGEVSDRNTWHLGGIAPHAGLFGPAGDLLAFAQGWFDAPETGYLPAALREQAWGPPPIPGGHVLGWDTVAPDGYTSAGRVLSARSHGHLAFTGPSLWIDPDRAVVVVLLCNRIHPSRDEPRLRALRPALHDAVARAVDAVQ